MADGKSKGGIARAKALSSERKSEIAAAAAAVRWGTPKATHAGTLQIGEIALPCAVLEDGTRVLSETGITVALLGSRSGASKRLKMQAQDVGAPLPLFLAPPRLKPFIDKHLDASALEPVKYLQGERVVIGYQADILPTVCRIWLEARAAGVLQRQQFDKARQAEALMIALAQVGIIALVDEATGFQEVRDRLALQAILDRYLNKEQAAWAKRFPDEFYRQIFRLRGWDWKGMRVQRPGVVAHYTRDLVYERLAPQLLQQLEQRNPPDEQGRRKARHHQWLTDSVGVPALSQHLHALIALMRVADSWDGLQAMVNRALPKQERMSDLPLFQDEAEASVVD